MFKNIIELTANYRATLADPWCPPTMVWSVKSELSGTFRVYRKAKEYDCKFWNCFLSSFGTTFCVLGNPVGFGRVSSFLKDGFIQRTTGLPIESFTC